MPGTHVHTRTVVTPPLNVSLTSGVYTLPEAAQILRLPLARLRTWVRGTVGSEGSDHKSGRRYAVGSFETGGSGRQVHFNFWSLMELFTTAQLRSQGVSARTLRNARGELATRFNTPYPFALRGLLTDGKRLLVELGDKVLLELSSGGQTAFESVIGVFCSKVDFDAGSPLAARFYPNGRQGGIVVDPRHAFGKPTLQGTNIAMETIASLLRAGESPEQVARGFDLSLQQVCDVRDFELQMAA